MTGFSAFTRKALTAAALVLGAALLAACETTGSGAPAATAQAPAAPAEPPMTHSRAAELCWMSTEKGSVNKCIDEKMKAAPAAPKS
jgi:hypothetical protein